MRDREIFPWVMAALAGVMANPVHAHKGAKPEELAELAIGAARATAAKLGAVEELPAVDVPARYDTDELGEVRAQVEALVGRVGALEGLTEAPKGEGQPAAGA